MSSISSSLLDCGLNLYSSLGLVYTETATPQCGQNIAEIAITSNGNCEPEVIVNTWVMENLFYNYERPPSDFISRAFLSQFTQIVW